MSWDRADAHASTSAVSLPRAVSTLGLPPWEPESSIDAQHLDALREARWQTAETVFVPHTTSIGQHVGLGMLRVWEHRVLPGPHYLPPCRDHVMTVVLRPARQRVRWRAAEAACSQQPKRGDVSLLPAGEPVFLEAQSPHLLLVLALAPEALVTGSTAWPPGAPPPRLQARLACSDETLAHFANGIRCAALRPTAQHFDAASRLLAAHLLDRYAAGTHAQTSAERALPGWLSRVFEHVDANLHTRITVAQLAKLAGYGAQHFTQIFNAAVGASPMRWVMDRRLERAHALVESSAASLTDIALELGFADSAHFSRSFRRRWGFAPSALRRLMP